MDFNPLHFISFWEAAKENWTTRNEAFHGKAFHPIVSLSFRIGCPEAGNFSRAYFFQRIDPASAASIPNSNQPVESGPYRLCFSKKSRITLEADRSFVGTGPFLRPDTPPGQAWPSACSAMTVTGAFSGQG